MLHRLKRLGEMKPEQLCIKVLLGLSAGTNRPFPSGKKNICISINKTVLGLLSLGAGLGLNSVPGDVHDQQQTQVSSSIVSGSVTMAPPKIDSGEFSTPDY
ncbi:hypothetical protein J6590_039540 [Homalodisca vitripennis]|nr:hypothetical protein J6590_039540 [Homalodisca vitripennis]